VTENRREACKLARPLAEVGTGRRLTRRREWEVAMAPRDQLTAEIERPIRTEYCGSKSVAKKLR
jgi:hypothetical protein